MQEEWKAIKGYEGLYSVSNMGRVFSIRSNRNIYQEKHRSSHNYYYRVSLNKNGNTSRFKVHRLVAQAFVTNPDNKPQVNHIDENTLNNYYSNLEWVNNKENANHGTRNTRVSKNNVGRHYETKGKPKISKVGKVYKLNDDNKVVETYSQLSHVKNNGYNPKAVGQAIKLGCRSGGYYWSR